MRCPRCHSEKRYPRGVGARGFKKFTCANNTCRHQFSETSATYMRCPKKPPEWYESVLALFFRGLNPCEISRALGMKGPKSIYLFLGRWRSEYARLHD
jgi:transposase-like protein